jgi:pyridoxine 4-dehydrogenase
MTTLVSESGTFDIGGDLTVNRLGYGAMQITGKGVWGSPADPAEAKRVLQRAVAQGVNLIDTADSYGPGISEELICEALRVGGSYPDDLVIATKAGLARPGPGDWQPIGRPEYLRQQCELSLRRLGVERIDLFQLHRIDPAVPVAESLGALTDLQDAGKIRHIGLSEVSVDELAEAQTTARIVSVQNRYNLADQSAETLLDHCEAEGIGFIPWFPLATGKLARDGGPLDEIAREVDAKPSQLALAWLLRRSPVMLPIPGTSSVSHLEDNLAAASIELTDDQFQRLSSAAG